MGRTIDQEEERESALDFSEVKSKGKSPWPAHPNTLSYEQVMFVDEVTEETEPARPTVSAG
ncbi:hypothetical protein KDD30_07770 [Photobacterium sp. GJ3]|uniref:hypothetical protein n=1 Tax=Photobacterium sp. GJ3 TaxID=2829502 RepID=UPI001B8D4DD8|nr:hypothetical protein [Photobacterium sp. GJ3]QUJ69219.1 hypothetical protein KDD30_07770 [Photobacterium sp. GJ3]